MNPAMQSAPTSPVLSRIEAGPSASERSTFAQFAARAVNRQAGRLADTLTGIADSIDASVARSDPQIGETMKDYAGSASDGLRTLARRTGDQDAADLISGLGRAAVRHPVVTTGIGAIVGAAFGVALVMLGRSANPPVSDGAMS